MLRRFVEEQAAAKRQVVILIDEAQNLSPDVLEELRLLTCIETEREKLVNVVLLGQPELSERLDSPQLEQLRQRCRLNIHIDELTREETAEYVRHRMAIAGGDFERAFAPGTEKSIYGYTGGVPRLINILCDLALVYGYADNRELIEEDLLREFLEAARKRGIYTQFASTAKPLKLVPEPNSGPTLGPEAGTDPWGRRTEGQQRS
jgi:general secretion pathway protein A